MFLEMQVEGWMLLDCLEKIYGSVITVAISVLSNTSLETANASIARQSLIR